MDDFDLDIDGMLDSGPSKPETKPEEKKKSFSKGNSLYKETNIIPKELDTNKFVKSDKKYFTIVDNNNLTKEKMDYLQSVATTLFKKGYIYRSPADERSKVDEMIRAIPEANVEVYKLFENQKMNSSMERLAVGSKMTTKLAYQIACNYHKTFTKLKDFPRCAFARLTQMLLGEEITSPVDFVIVYTECGSTSFGKSFKIQTAGSVWFVFKITAAASIPVFNINNENFLKSLKTHLDATTKKEESSNLVDELL